MSNNQQQTRPQDQKQDQRMSEVVKTEVVKATDNLAQAIQEKPPTHAGSTTAIAEAIKAVDKKSRVWMSFADLKSQLEAAKREQLDSSFFGAVQDGRVLPLGGGDYLMLLQIAGKSGVRLDIRKVYTETFENAESGDREITKDSLLKFGKGYSGSNLHRMAICEQLGMLK